MKLSDLSGVQLDAMDRYADEEEEDEAHRKSAIRAAPRRPTKDSRTRNLTELCFPADLPIEDILPWSRPNSVSSLRGEEVERVLVILHRPGKETCSSVLPITSPPLAFGIIR